MFSVKTEILRRRRKRYGWWGIWVGLLVGGMQLLNPVLSDPAHGLNWAKVGMSAGQKSANTTGQRFPLLLSFLSSFPPENLFLNIYKQREKHKGADLSGAFWGKITPSKPWFQTWRDECIILIINNVFFSLIQLNEYWVQCVYLKGYQIIALTSFIGSSLLLDKIYHKGLLWWINVLWPVVHTAKSPQHKLKLRSTVAMIITVIISIA